MVADVPGIGALDHRNACVVIDRDDADRHAGEQLARDTRMSEGVDRYLTRIETGRRDGAREWARVVYFVPMITVRLGQQRLGRSLALCGLAQLCRQRYRNGPRSPRYLFLTPALA